MKDLLLHPQTRKALEQLIERKPHAVMLSGNEGSGKRHIALSLASELLGVSADTHPYFLHISPNGKALTIEQVRILQGHMRLRTTGTGAVRRIAILEDAHLMTTEAQNALLKLLEEPPTDTVLILTVQDTRALKPTVYSRVQHVPIKPISRDQAATLISGDNRLYDLSGGDVGLLHALAEKKEDHELTKAIGEAKHILQATSYGRLLRVDELSKDSERLENLLVACKRISRTACKAAYAKQDSKAAQRWLRILEATHEAEKQRRINVNPKLVLSELFLSF